MLFTHRGLSGPAILQISSYWDGQGSISIDLAPDIDLNSLLRRRDARDQAAWKSLLREILPRRLADRWLETHPLAGNSAALCRCRARSPQLESGPGNNRGLRKAEVTAGGVDTDELHARTMEVRKVPGLFFIGELVDVTGQLGGFNFQWAWASGFAPARQSPVRQYYEHWLLSHRLGRLRSLFRIDWAQTA